jgi:peptide/nickel transport system permease protein
MSSDLTNTPLELTAAVAPLGDVAASPLEPTAASRRRRRRPPVIVIVAVAFLVLICVVAITAPWLAPHDPNKQSLIDASQNPSSEQWLGTDEFGRDVLSRLMYGARFAVLAPLIAVGIGIVLGIPAGLIAGYRSGGPVAWVLGVVFDTFQALPGLVLALGIIGAVGPGFVSAMIAIGVIISPGLFRLTRAVAQSVRQEPFIESAQSIGCGPIRTISTHVLPNIAGPLFAQIALLAGVSLIAEAALSFLGLGVQPPSASWGVMLRNAFDNTLKLPYGVIPAGLLITLTVLALNLLGDHLSIVVGRRTRSE